MPPMRLTSRKNGRSSFILWFLRRALFFCPLSVSLSCHLSCPLSPVTVLPCQLGAESDRAPCPAPVTCHCHLSTHNISRFFSSPMQAVRPPSRITFSFWSVAPFLFGLLPCTPARLYSSVCPSCPPPCPMFPNASIFFCYPAPNGPSFRVSWWIQTLFLGEPRSHL